jgi:hypothetical protein
MKTAQTGEKGEEIEQAMNSHGHMGAINSSAIRYKCSASLFTPSCSETEIEGMI